MYWGMTTNVLRAAFVSALFLPAGPAPAQDQPPAAGIDDALIERLQQTVSDFDYDREDVARIIDDLRHRFGLNIHVSWKALEAAGIQPDERVSITLTQVPLTTFLDLLLLESVDDERAEVSYFVSNGVLMMSTELVMRPPTVLRTYNITDLIESGYSIRRFANTPVLSLDVTGREFVGGEKVRSVGGGGGGSTFGDPGSDPARYSRMERIQEYVDLVVEHITPEDWVQMGGDVATVQVVNGTLFVQHTVQAHQQIGQLLSTVRATKPTPVDVDALIVRVRPEVVDTWRRKAGEAFPRLDPETAKELFAETDAAETLLRATSSGFNGQGVWFSAVTQRDVLVGFTPIVGDGVNAFAPAQGIVTDGIELVVLPLLMPDGERAEIDVQFAWIPPADVDERCFTPASGAEQTSVDVTRRRMRTVSSTAKVAIGQAIALAIPETPEADDEYEEWLVVRVREAQP